VEEKHINPERETNTQHKVIIIIITIIIIIIIIISLTEI
jgi:hypothetical protein